MKVVEIEISGAREEKQDEISSEAFGDSASAQPFAKEESLVYWTACRLVKRAALLKHSY